MFSPKVLQLPPTGHTCLVKQFQHPVESIHFRELYEYHKKTKDEPEKPENPTNIYRPIDRSPIRPGWRETMGSL